MIDRPRRFRSAWDLGGLSLPEALRRAGVLIRERELMTRAAAITFYALASLAPFLGLVVLLAASLLPWIARGRDLDVSGLLHEAFPAEMAKLVAQQLDDVRSRPNAGSASVGTLALLWLSSSLFMAIMEASNVIAGVKETRPYWKRRLIGVGMAVLLAVLVLLALVSTLPWSLALGTLPAGPVVAVLASLVHGVIVFGLALTSFAAATRFAPNVRRRWEWLTPGGVLGSLLLVAVGHGFRFESQSWGNQGATYGSLAGVVMLTTWIWLCGAVLLAAAAFNQVIASAIDADRAKAAPDHPPALDASSPNASVPESST